MAVLALAGCGGALSPPPPGEPVDCAIGAGAAFAPDCTLEREPGAAGLVIHHPGGGFRRFVIDPASGALVPADGAEPLLPEVGEAGALQFAIGADRYRIAPERLGALPQ